MISLCPPVIVRLIFPRPDLEMVGKTAACMGSANLVRLVGEVRAN